MEKYTAFLGILFFLIFSFQQCEGNLIEEEKPNVDINEVFSELGKVGTVNDQSWRWENITEKCNAQGDVWYCCVGIESKMNFTACLSIAYLEEEYGLELNVTIDGIVIIHKKSSLKNPPPICFHVPYLEKIADACFRLYDLDERNKTFTGCTDFEGHVEGFKVFKFEMGCFKIPLNWLEKRFHYSAKMIEQILG